MFLFELPLGFRKRSPCPKMSPKTPGYHVYTNREIGLGNMNGKYIQKVVLVSPN